MSHRHHRSHRSSREYDRSDRSHRHHRRSHHRDDGYRDRHRGGYRDNRRSSSSWRGSREREREQELPDRNFRDSPRDREPHTPTPDPEEFFAKIREKGTGWDKLPDKSKPEILPPTTNAHNPMQERSQRRLYIGNVPSNINQEQLIEFFNTAMVNANAGGEDGRPIIDCTLNSEKAYAFLDFSNAEQATVGMSFDGITLSGQSLRVRRPRDYQPTINPGDAKEAALHLNIVSTNVGDSPHKIYIGGLPQDLNEADVKELLTSFGTLKSFNLVRDSNSGNSKGFAFCEYVDSDITDYACQSLNGMQIGEKTLIVQRASVNAKSKEEASQVSNPVNERVSEMLNMNVPAQQLLAASCRDTGITPSDFTNVLALCNCVNVTAIRDDVRYKKTIQDMKIECQKFGAIKEIVIPRKPGKKREKKSEALIPIGGGRTVKIKSEYGEGTGWQEEDPLNPSVPEIGKLFVVFENVEDAKEAQMSLAGRRYDGRMVITQFFPMDRFEKLKSDLADLEIKWKKEEQEKKNFDPFGNYLPNSLVL